MILVSILKTCSCLFIQFIIRKSFVLGELQSIPMFYTYRTRDKGFVSKTHFVFIIMFNSL